MKTLEEFLNQYVDRYLWETCLLGNLASMAAINTGGDGSVGHPMVMSIVSRCELLGRLLFDKVNAEAFTA